MTLRGTPAQQRLAVDILVLWWLVLGIPLAWEKGSFVDGRAEHDWIGVRFSSPSPGLATMTIPPQFREALLTLASKFAAVTRKSASLKEAYNLCGRAGRLAQVVPEVTPFVGQLYAALAAGLHSHHIGLREAPPLRVATRRYRVAANWLCALLKDTLFPLSHTLRLNTSLIPVASRRVEFDASPWGGAAVLLEQGTPTEFAIVTWDALSADRCKITTGIPKWQSFWELAVFRPLWSSQWKFIFHHPKAKWLKKCPGRDRHFFSDHAQDQSILGCIFPGRFALSKAPKIADPGGDLRGSTIPGGDKSRSSWVSFL